MRWLAVALSATYLACGIPRASHGEVTDRAKISGYALTITSGSTGCRLTYQRRDVKGEMILVPQPPCYFLRRESREPQSFTYPDVAVQAAMIIVGSSISNDTRMKWNLPNHLACGQALQGILVKKSEIVSTKNVLQDGVWCKDKGTDEKDFWYFAHETP